MQTYAETIGTETAIQFGLDPNAIDPSTVSHDSSNTEVHDERTKTHNDLPKVRKFKKNFSGQWN